MRLLPWTDPLLILLSCFIVMVAPLQLSGTAHGQEPPPGPAAPSGDSGQAPEAPETPDGGGAQETRRDNTFGTMHEGIVMERDPVTGDHIIQVTPPPREEQDQQAPDVWIIQPEIHVKPK